MDTVVVFLGEVSKSWWAENAYWWVPAGTVFVTLFGVFISARISNRNTNKMIKNQNVEGRRPFIKIVDVINGFHLNEPKYAIDCLNPEHDSTHYIDRSLKIINIGYGPAENIIVKMKDDIQIERHQIIFDVITGGITKKSDSTLSLGTNEIGNINLQVFVAGPEKYRPKYIDIIIMYSDLLNNIYQTNARIGLTHRLKISQYVEKSKDWEIFFNNDCEKDYRKK